MEENQRPVSAVCGKWLSITDGADAADGDKARQITIEEKGKNSYEPEEPVRRRISEVIAECIPEWFEEALEEAINGDLYSMVIVAQMYYRGYGVPVNIGEAYLWIKRVEERGFPVWKFSDKRPGYLESDSDTG